MNPNQMQVPQGSTIANMQVGQSTDMRELLFRILRSGQPPAGWHQTVRPEDRYPYLNQLATNLTLIAGNNEPSNRAQTMKVVHAAGEMERKCFFSAPSREGYMNNIGKKLNEIRSIRQRAADNMGAMNVQQAQQQLPFQAQMQGNGLGQNQGQFLHGFPQLQQQSNAPQPIMVQPSRTQLQPNQQNLNQINQQAMPQQSQQIQQRPMQGMTLSPDERAHVNRLSEQLFERGKQSGDIHRVQQIIQQIPVEKRQQMLRDGADPIHYHYRQQAAVIYRKQKEAHMQAQFAAQPQNQSFGQPMPNMMNPNQAQPMRIINGPGMMGPSPGNPNFDLSQFVGQQADAQRQQEAGDLVVPASNNQYANTQFPAPLGALGGLGVGRPNPGSNAMVPQTPQGPVSNARKGKTQPNQQVSQTPTPATARARQNAQNQTQHHAQPQQKPAAAIPLHGQVGGLHSSQQTQLPSPAMRVLNQPLAQAGGVQQQPQQGSAPDTSHTTQQSNLQQFSRPQQGQQQTEQVGGIQFPPNFPQKFRERFANVPPDKVRVLIEKWQQQSQGISQGFQAQQGQVSQQHEQNNASMPNNQGGSNPMMANGQQGGTLPQGSMYPGNFQPPVQSSTPNQPGQQPSMAEQARFADSMLLPRAILKRNFPTLDIPDQVKTWGDLKRWMQPFLQQNQAHFAGIDLKAVFSIQRQQLFNVRQKQAGAQQPLANGVVTQQSQPTGLAAQPSNKLETAPQGPANPSIQIMNGVPTLRPVTQQDIQAFRNTFGSQAAGISDRDISNKIMTDRLKRLRVENPQLAQQIIAHMQKRNPPEQQQGPNYNPNLPPNQQGQQPRVPIAGAAAQTLTSGSLSVGNHFSQPMPSPRGQHSAFEAANVKFSNNGPPALQGHNQAHGTGFQVSQGVIQPTPEQLSQMTAEQRLMMEAQIRARSAEQQRLHLPDQSQTKHEPGLPLQPAQGNGPDAEKELKYQYILRDAFSNRYTGHTKQLPPEVKAQMALRVQQAVPLVKQAEKLVRPFFFYISMNEALLRETINWCNILRFQKPQEGEYTITLEELNDYASKLRRFCEMTMTRLRENRDALQGSSNAAPQQMPVLHDVAAQADKGQPAQESAGTQPGQAPSMIRKPSVQSRGSAKAPTLSTPGKPLYSPPGHGAPVYAPNTGFQPENLTLPLKKKRKQAEQGDSATPTPLMGAATRQSPKVQQEQTRKAAPSVKVEPIKVEEQPLIKVVYPFKCPIPHCEYHITGFESQAETDKHAADVHDYHGNAVEWCLANMRKALSLDEKGKTVVKASKIGTEEQSKGAKGPHQADVKPLIAGLKTELLTPAATPMSRGPTQNGAKVETPSNNLLKTPQPGMKAGSPEGSGTSMKRTTSTFDSLKPNASAISAKSLKTSTPLPGPWTNSLVSPDAIAFAFAGLDGSVTDDTSPPPTTWVNTPESAKSGNSSDASSTAALRVTLDEWEPFPKPGGEGAGSTNQKIEIKEDEGWEELDWDAMYGPKAGLEEDASEKSELFANYWDGVQQPEFGFEMIEQFEWAMSQD